MIKSRFLALGLATLFFAAILALSNHFGWLSAPANWIAGLRWLGILLFIVDAIKRRSLTFWIMIGMVAGAEFGHDWPTVAVKFQILSTIFVRLIKVIIAPLLFSTLVLGIAGHPNLKKLGRIGIKGLVYFEIVSTLALVIGFVAIHITQAGVGVHLPPNPSGENSPIVQHSPSDPIAGIFPQNIAEAISGGQILQLVIFSILFGVALAMVPGPKRQPLVAFSSSLSETMFKFTNVVMLGAPLGVFGGVAYTVGHLGIAVLLPLLKLMATMYAALAAFLILVLLPVAFLIRLPLLRFLKAVREPVSVGFGTASSEAALPLAMENMEALGVSRETVALVLPTGYSFNLAGSGLYQSMALVFVAEAAGIHLSFSQQAAMLLTLLVSSKGTAGVARGALVVVLAVAPSFHLPSEPIFLLFAIDQLMDMARTGVNVLGNCLATVVIARWEGETGVFQSEAVETCPAND